MPPIAPAAPGVAPFVPTDPRVTRTWFDWRFALAPFWTQMPTANGPVVFVITLFAMKGAPACSTLIPVNVLLIAFLSTSAFDWFR